MSLFFTLLQGPSIPLNWRIANTLVADLWRHLGSIVANESLTPHNNASGAPIPHAVIRAAHAETLFPLATALGVLHVSWPVRPPPAAHG